MKIFKSLLLVALMVASFTLSANNDPEKLQVKSKVVENQSIVVQLFNLQQELTTMSIISMDGKTTYCKKFVKDHNGYSWKIDLEEMPEGRYVLEVQQGDTVKKQVMLIRSDNVQLSSVKG